MMKSNRKIRYVMLVLLGILILANMIMITSFSLDSKEESGELSHGVTEQVVIILKPDYVDMPPEEQDATIEKFHLPIRKLAHFSEFCLLGMLCAGFMQILGKFKYWVWWVSPAVVCLLYAASDEILQIFVKRGPSVKDVGIDFLGSLVGIALVHGLCAWVFKCRQKKGANGQ